MGYTHYWQRVRSTDQYVWDAACVDVRLLLRKADKLIALEFDTPGLPPVCDRDQVRFNGRGKQGYETFWFPRRVFRDDLKEDGRTFEFCKTDCKPYDGVVCATLAVLSGHFGDALHVTSDGDEEWREHVAWASQVLGRPVKVPAGIAL